MAQLIGLKELQKNTRRIREAVAKGTHFIVVYRSQPIFEIKPIKGKLEFAEDLESTGLYSGKFIKRMQKAEADVRNGNTKQYSTDEFLESLF